MIALSVNARDFVPGKGLHPSRPRPKLDQKLSGKERENDPSKWLEEETKQACGKVDRIHLYAEIIHTDKIW